MEGTHWTALALLAFVLQVALEPQGYMYGGYGSESVMPKYLQTGKYAQSFSSGQSQEGYQGTKNIKRNPGIKTTFTKTGGSSGSYIGVGGASGGTGGSSYSYGGGGMHPMLMGSNVMQFPGGCTQQPVAPLNSMLRCSQYSGCRATCNAGYRFPNGETQLFITCREGTWRVDGSDWDYVPPCEPVCTPPCENNGICYEPNTCNCPESFSGPYCQFEKRPCLNYPPLPLNARRTCNSKQCTVKCLQDHKFPDGSSVAYLLCKEGEWKRQNGGSGPLSDCRATCTPPCQNGGECLGLNICNCPQHFRGPQCQYSVDACNPKRLNFNGGYNCSGDAEMFRCSIRCPTNADFEFSPSATYTCQYSTGTFLPQPVPQCQFTEMPFRISDGGHQMFETKNWNSQMAMITNDTKTGTPFSEKVQHVTMEVRPAPGSCFTWGGAHYKTFDGATFSAASDCAHVMVRDAADGTFSIVTQNSPGCKTGSDCYLIINIYLQDKQYTFKKNKKNLPVLQHGTRTLPLPTQIPGLRANVLPNHVLISMDSLGVTLLWNMELLLQVEVSAMLWNRTAGLCGRLDNHLDNDMTARDGTEGHTSAVLLNSWQADAVGSECDSTPRAEHACDAKNVDARMAQDARAFCTSLLADKRFAPCHAAMDVSVLLDACRWDYCACANRAVPSECACHTMDVYVRECRHKGVRGALANWRDEHTCPMRCTGRRIYHACAPDRQPTCGSDNLDDWDSSDEETGSASNTVADENCEEGCYCPPGLVLHEEQCIQRSDCPCQLRGQSFKPGESIPKDCNTCTCENGQWKCTQVTCGARCSSIGDPHYETFDGKRYDFMGQCSYYLVRGDNYSVEAENVACTGAISLNMNFPRSVSSGMPSCTKSVTVRTEAGHILRLKQNRDIFVDGKDVTKLPYAIGKTGDVIRQASSVFVIVELSNGLQIWWDGITRVYIDVPASFRGATRGLCGIFNSKQHDDFFTPEGDIEPAIEQFANKWKTNERCPDTPRAPQHPCDANVHKKSSSEEHCAILRSEAFSSCHWSVDPELYYQDCIYDMCACETRISTCLCPIIAAYAQECARHNMIVDWRNQVPACGMLCIGGQTFMTCGDSCARSCSDLSEKPDCQRPCVEGCFCLPGETLDERGECIPVGQCPCYYDGIRYPAGYKEIRPATLAQELCTCINAVWTCQPATKDEIAKYPKSDELKAVCSSSKNQEFTSCEPEVLITCRNMHQRDLVSASHKLEDSSASCRPGCRCKPGYVLLDAHDGGGRCILPTDCPCHHGGRSYNDTDEIRNDCNTCKCAKGQWECTKNVCSGVCSAWGDSHYTTFDGRAFDYQGQCDYILAKGKLGKYDSFDVIVQNVPCGTLGVSCSRAVSVSVGKEIVRLTRDKPITASQRSSLKRMTLRELDSVIIIEAEDLGLSVTWDRGTRVYIRVDPRWSGRMRGLCGNYNGDQQDDFQTPSGGFSEASVRVFGDSWRVHSYCPEATDVEDTCEQRPERRAWALRRCGVLKTDLFAPCHNEVPEAPFLERCVFDTCACDQGGDCECLCTALAAYAYECSTRGVPIRWRSNDLCPMQCDEHCSDYTPCMAACPLETCDNLLDSTKAGRLCEKEPCVEGCSPKECPQGQVYLNASSLECVPRNTCKPICMEVDGVIYSEGDLMEEDECQRCYCTRNKKVCTGKPCFTSGTRRPGEIQSTPPPMDEQFKCHSGWSTWVNQDKPKPTKTKAPTKTGKPRGRKLDIEPLLTPTILGNLPDGGRCSQDQMRDIQCRTVDGHIDPKATGLDVECSLERGLVCKADRSKRLLCPDFETRVLCDCEMKEGPFVTAVSPLAPESCDVNAYYEHPTDCHAFLQCAPTDSGNILIEKTCGPDMLYNPKSQTCDWPEAVLELRPKCAQQKPPRPLKPPPPELFAPQPQVCPPRFRYVECAIECHRLCLYHSHVVVENGGCLTGEACQEGCIQKNRELSCPVGQLWRDNSTCVEPEDCMCRSHDGSPVKPGTVYRESDCEFCQCIDNHYTCDRSECLTLSTIPSIFETSDEDQMSVNRTGEPAISAEEHVIWLPPSKVTPPKRCAPERLVMLADGPWPLNDAAFSARTILDESHQPWNARISGRVTQASAGSWAPKRNNRFQYVQIDLGEVEPVYGIVLKGSPVQDAYVTSYHVLYSNDGKSWQYVARQQNVPQLFHGSVDQHTPVRQMFEPPFEARFIRIKPQSWHRNIHLRFDVLGCSELTTPEPHVTITPVTLVHEIVGTTPVEGLICDEPMGFNDGRLPEQQVMMSSRRNTGSPRLDSERAWQPMNNNPNEWIKFDFSDDRNITGMETRGGPDGWVRAYQVQYSHDDFHWNPILDDYSNEKLFLGNIDQDTPHRNTFERPIKTRFVRVVPKKWTKNIQMRVEPIGCFEPYDITTPETPVTTLVPSGVFEECNYCPGLEPPPPPPGAQPLCRCDKTRWWDGEQCVSRAQCPCLLDHLKYPVGTVFEKEDCSECLCALGGTAQCAPKRCKPCERPGFRPVLSPTCACVCKPCPEGQVLCPTSGICLNETSWCNGVVECPDDEVNCVATVEPPMIKESVKDTAQKRKKCPEMVCPPGYRVKVKKPSRYEELHKNLSPMFSMYGGRKGPSEDLKITATKGQTKTIGYKGALVLPRQPGASTKSSTKSKQKQAKKDCDEFVCVPEKWIPPLTGATTPPCPEPVCPPRYTVVFQESTENELMELLEPLEPGCPEYDCKPPPPREEVCNVTGRTYSTFDGVEYRYDICNHVLARDMAQEEWDVSLVKNCTSTNSCTRNLIIRHGNQLVKMFPDLSLEFDGYRYSASQVTKIGAKSQAFTVSRVGNTLLFVSNHYGFWVLWDQYLTVRVGITEKLKGQVDGLCGYFDGDPANDKRKPDGTIARSTPEFGDSWFLGGVPSEQCDAYVCPLHIQNRALFMCQSVLERVLAPCHHVHADVDAWVNSCLESMCQCLEREQKEESCRCDAIEAFVVECRAAKPEVQLDDWRVLMECPATCPAPLVHHDCFRRRCEPSCDNLAEPDACPLLPSLCFPGCYCPPGLVRKKNKCVPPRECRDCECNVLPHLEYVTFDGTNHTANTNCTYLMAREKIILDDDKHDFEVFITNGPCPLNPLKMCTSIITLLYNDHRVQIMRGVRSVKDLRVFIDDVELLQLPFDNGWVEVTRLPTRHINVLVRKIQLELRAYHPTLGASLRVPSPLYGGQMEGLCGDCDRNPNNDRVAPDGTKLYNNPAKFVDSWLKDDSGNSCIKEEVPECEEVLDISGQDPCLALLDVDRFGHCHMLLDPAIFLSTCHHDTCGGRAELACSSLETYALGCRGQGLCLDWHIDLCPAKICAAPTHYELCGPPCARTCERPHGCGGLPSEGCFCPEGLLMKNGTCVEERSCYACDDQGHYPGDTWEQDACTTCMCDENTRTVHCETRQCPPVDKLCEEGYQPLKIRRTEAECCDKYACVPVGTVPPVCDEPKPLTCAADQDRKLEKRPDGCHQFVCQCIPADECEPIEESTPEPLPDGIVLVRNESGCCPKLLWVCKPELCPKPESCPEHYHHEEQLTDTCCPVFKCMPPPDKCLVVRKYTAADRGGERELTPLEQKTIVLELNATLEDGPCRRCQCVPSSSPDSPPQAMCTGTECSAINDQPGQRDYVLEEEWVRNQCCPGAKRVACRHDGKVYKVDERWPVPDDPCAELQCTVDKNDEVTKTRHVLTCDKSCKLGFEYEEPEKGSEQCCGTCKQIACVVDGKIKEINETWTSEDFCSIFRCANENGTVVVKATEITCPELSEELLEDFVYDFVPMPGECCGRNVPKACRVGDQEYRVGDAWPDPGGNPCVTVECLHSGAGGGELTHQRTVRTCSEMCRPGWRYLPATPESGQCCGECIQVACVVNGTVHEPGSQWPSSDGCASHECSMQSDGTLTTVTMQETCPDTNGCPLENLYVDGCCMRCNLTALPKLGACEPVEKPPSSTVGLIREKVENHGLCYNKNQLHGLSECRGQCHSATLFNPKSSEHEVSCTCCSGIRYETITVELVCIDGYRYKKKIQTPTACACEECSFGPTKNQRDSTKKG